LSEATDQVEIPAEIPGVAVNYPRDGLPHVIETDAQLAHAVASLALGTGPVAVDAERASGFRYSQRAYLIQIRRAGSGTHMFDPTGLTTLQPLQEVLEGVDWILHAASQDLVCLAEAGLTPTAQLFDTELAGRLLGRPRVGLGTLLHTDLGYILAKEHSAADWSTRPLPESWLVYAALDVEFLLELWEVMSADLRATGKYEWAIQEFDHVHRNTAPIVRTDPWRRTSGMHALKKPAQLAIVRALWEARDELAARKDIAPGRVLPDSTIVSLAGSPMDQNTNLDALPALRTRQVRRHVEVWIKAIEKALQLPSSDYPPVKIGQTGPPNPRNWVTRSPQAWARLEFARAKISELAEVLCMPPENLISPDAIRRTMWEPPALDEMASFLSELKVRTWQQQQVIPIFAEAISIGSAQNTSHKQLQIDQLPETTE
jgi:ribonuclease D